MDTFFVAVGFVIFLGVLGYFGVHKTLLGMLDARGKKVQEQLDAAANLRKEAETLLAQYEAKRTAAEKEAAQIVEDARAEAGRIQAEQEAKLAEFVARRTKQAEQKIAMAEVSAAAEVRAAAADAAIRAAEIVLKGQATGSVADDLISQGLKDVRARLN
ncbi:MAG: ATP F0F1 synthase subunit B [Methylocystis sp.]|nr:ATP F0F1 synthase subunit B [Methylocystis sp.]MCA3582531.1 ATP F0F1 synthase subunit B [Methylocystis sp.]MCA3589424.1 ATP F0F1 synthase subunit B [Methylocystis sp.]MCA3591090.1 ATP F0F1 synthase subunit B [Methylocystis sp.]